MSRANGVPPGQLTKSGHCTQVPLTPADPGDSRRSYS